MANEDRPEDETASAEEAFEALRQEVAALRQEIAELPAAWRAALPPPPADYSSELTAMRRSLIAIEKRLAPVGVKPNPGSLPKETQNAGLPARDSPSSQTTRRPAAAASKTAVRTPNPSRGQTAERMWLWLSLALVLGLLLTRLLAYFQPFGWRH